MSENGPREGTKDLPHRDRDAGHRSPAPDSPAGRAYGSISRATRRRRAQLADWLAAGVAPARIIERYAVEHPLERAVTLEELRRLRAAIES